jgi:arylsulfatase A-like enzyme
MTPSTSPATAAYGALAGIQAIAAYAAIEILLDGPFTIEAGQSVGASYSRTVFLYVLLYLVLGALAGALAGFGLGRRGVPRYQVAPFISAVLILVFLANGWLWGYSPGTSAYLALLPGYALWLFCGLLFDEEDKARTVAGSPWPAAIVTLAPVSIAFALMAGSSAWLRHAVAGGIYILVLAISLLARRRRWLAAIALGKPQAALTIAVLLASFGTLHMVATPNTVTAAGQGSASGRPNIVLITLDTTRADHLSLYGYKRRTSPHLDAFASAATLYRHAYANGDMTLASHASMFTGLFPTEHGAHYDGDFRYAIAPEVPTLAELLHKAGYRTFASVANTALLDPNYGFARGFDRYVMPRRLAVVSPLAAYQLRMGLYKLTLPWLWTEAMRRFVDAREIAAEAERLVMGADGDPFFLFVNFMESHRPWIAADEYRARFSSYDQSFDEMKIRSFCFNVTAGKHTVSATELARMHAAYDGSIAYLDSVAGELIERFRRRPWYNDSLVIVTADHGELFGENGLIEHGNSVNRGLTSIPMIVKFPGQTASSEVQSPVSQVDLFSTIGVAAGIAMPGARRGVDLAVGDPGEERSLIIESYPSVVFTKLNPNMDRVERALVKGRWKMITSTRGRCELYDMVSDPEESKNVWSAHPEIAGELEGRLRKWAAASNRHPPAKHVPQDPELLRRLRTLGYIQ